MMFVWTFSDVMTIALVFLGLAGSAYFQIGTLIQQSRCKHIKYRETQSCDAICQRCGKNLGFIGTVKNNRETTE